MFENLKAKISQFLRETVTGSVIVNVIAAILFALFVFIIGFYLDRRGQGSLSRIAEQVLKWAAPYMPYAITVLITIIIIRLFSFVKKIRQRAPSTAIRIPVIQSPRGFVGRKLEIQSFVSMLSGRTKETFYVVHGISGSGKTWLVNRLLEESQKYGSLIASVDFRRQVYTHISLINEIALQLGYKEFGLFKQSLHEYASLQQQFRSKFELVDRSLAAIIAQQDEEVVLSFMADLRTLSTAHKIVIAFDTYEQLKDQELKSWINRRLLLSIREKLLENVYVIISGWDSLSLGSDWSKSIVSQRLSNLTVSEIKQCLELELGKGNVEDHVADSVYDLTSKGCPLFVGLACNLLIQAKDEGLETSADVLRERAVEFDEMAVAELLMDRILTGVPSEAAEAIRLCAIPRWFDATMLRDALGVLDSQPVIDLLTSYRSFIHRHRIYGYEYHHMVRDMLLLKWRNQDRGQYLALNKKLVDYYQCMLRTSRQTLDEERAVVELIYHSAIADPEESLQIFRKYMDEAIGYYDINLAEQLALQGKQSLTQNAAAPWLDFYEGQLAYLKGKWRETERICLKLLQMDGADTLLLALSGNALGQIYYYQGEFDEAIKAYENSEALISASEGNDDLIGEVFENSAKAYRNIGQLTKAEDCHKIALTIADENKKEQKLATISVDMATTYILQGKWENAIQCCAKGIESFSRINNKRSLGRSLRNLAWAQMYAGQLEQATETSSRALELAIEVHDSYNIGIGHLNLGRIKQLSEDWNDALGCYNRALQILKPLGAETDVGSLFEGIATCTRDPEKWSEALDYYNRSIKIFRDIRYRYGLSLCLHNLATRYRDLGEPDSAVPLFKESEEIARCFQIHYWRGKALLGLLTIECDRLSPEEINAGLKSDLENLISTYRFHDLSSLFLLALASNALRHSQTVEMAIVDQLFEALNEGHLYHRCLARKIVDGVKRTLEDLIRANRPTDAAHLCHALSHKLTDTARFHGLQAYFIKLAKEIKQERLSGLKDRE